MGIMSNTWRQLISLLPSVDTTVGKILSVNTETGSVVLESIGTGDYTATYPTPLTMEPGLVAQSGNVEYLIGDWVLVKDGVIVAKLPVPELDSNSTTHGAKEIMIS
jgi:hypothetical protein